MATCAALRQGCCSNLGWLHIPLAFQITFHSSPASSENERNCSTSITPSALGLDGVACLPAQTQARQVRRLGLLGQYPRNYPRNASVLAFPRTNVFPSRTSRCRRCARRNVSIGYRRARCRGEPPPASCRTFKTGWITRALSAGAAAAPPPRCAPPLQAGRRSIRRGDSQSGDVQTLQFFSAHLDRS